MSKPYGIISDTHHHAWTAFGVENPDGVNSRLQLILNETMRCALAVQAAGGDTIYHAGDLFHVRGSVAPSVLNPTYDLYRKIKHLGIKVVFLAGNHDLEGKEARRVSSAVTAMEGAGHQVVNSYEHGLNLDDQVIMHPWCQDIKQLKANLEAIPKDDRKVADLILHAPVNGVIMGIPDHGLDGAYLASLGFRRVFTGHYHNHKEVVPGVWSIGALTHQTWSDVGTKAGFLIVSDEGVKWNSTRAPHFVEIDASTDPSEAPLIVDGNYVRVRINSGKVADIEAVRQQMIDWNALGVVVIPQPVSAAPTRIGSSVKAGASIEISLEEYIQAGTYDEKLALSDLCSTILAEARAGA
jgi:DNA repair exonuclease SbcCD nuclease subunit